MAKEYTMIAAYIADVDLFKQIVLSLKKKDLKTTNVDVFHDMVLSYVKSLGLEKELSQFIKKADEYAR